MVGSKTLPVATSLVLLALTGCVAGNRPNFVRTGSESEGKTFYLDGAGNFGVGKDSVPRGLADGGYLGKLEHFIWTTYMGPLADQIYLKHNRRAAEALARRIERYKRARPNRSVNIIALSAGTGIAVFALEELQPEFHVDNVVLLSSSLSAAYPLDKALPRVDGGIYVFWSPNDPILRGVVPIVGTVDRAGFGVHPAGTNGMRLRSNPLENTRELYRKVHNIRWYPSAARGLMGKVVSFRHAGATSKEFIRELVAPILIMPEPSPPVRSAPNSVGRPRTPLPPAPTTRTPATRRATPRTGAGSTNHAGPDAGPGLRVISPTRSGSG